MFTLGHITYSNCFPPHAGIITGKTRFPFRIVEGIPTELNRLLSEGAIDVSPSSSIEYAKNSQRYILLPDLSITSRDRVRSIILQSSVPIEELGGKTIALTSASATSVLLLRILLEIRYGVHSHFREFDQGREEPFPEADAALFIGDLGLKREKTPTHPHLYDLGALWHEFTGLPFVFALWQVHYKKDIDYDLGVLYDILIESKAYGLGNLKKIANEQAQRFGLPARLLFDYWSSLSYGFGIEEKKGLLAYYKYASEIGAIRPVTELRIWERK